ncbi:MAG TPA: response regulator [Blastocatellia bacterium]|nr:response regulator [Blastocatellia bacterium]
MKVMVVDDEHDIQLLFDQQFRREIRSGQIEFHYAFSGEEALKYLESVGPADLILILSDINMPGMNGLELLKIIKDRFALKVFMITAYGDESNYKTAMEYGADNYLTKPIDFKVLKQEVLGLQES